MTTTPPDPAATVPDAEAGGAKPEAPPPRKRRWKRYLIISLVSPLLAFTVYTAFVYFWPYSEGERSGYLQKISRKGWLCKTWEGELAMTTAPGVAPEIWAFTVRKDSIAAVINAALGSRVVLHYGEHRGLWSSCFGETPYFVTGVRVLAP